MYHIPNDRRALRSADTLYHGLLDSLKTKSYIDVTVRDLCVVSGVSRATFYRLFDNISDILTWKCEMILLQALEQAESCQFPAALESFVNAWFDNRRLMETLIQCDRTEILYEVHEKHIEDFRVAVLSDIEVSEIQSDYLSSVLAAILPAAFRMWVQYPEEPMMIVTRLRDCFGILDKMLSSV